MDVCLTSYFLRFRLRNELLTSLEEKVISRAIARISSWLGHCPRKFVSKFDEGLEDWSSTSAKVPRGDRHSFSLSIPTIFEGDNTMLIFFMTGSWSDQYELRLGTKLSDKELGRCFAPE